MQVKGNATHDKEKIQNPKWRKYLARAVLSWLWYVRLFGPCCSVVLKNISGWSGATSHWHWIKARGKGTTPLPTALPFSLCLQSQPSTHCAPSKIQNGFIYTSLSFTLLDILLPTRKGKKESRAHCHADAASTCWPQGEFPNAAISHVPIDPASVPVDHKKMVKSLCHT